MSCRRFAPVLLCALLLSAVPLACLALPANADSFLTDETFFPIADEQSQVLQALSWDSAADVAAALGNDPDPLFHMRLITQAYFQWTMAEAAEADKSDDFLSTLDEQIPESADADYLPLFDLGYAMMVLQDDLNGLGVLEATRRIPTEEPAGFEEAAPAQEREEPAVFLALALCYAQTDAFLFGNSWEEPTNLKREAVLNLQKAALYANGSEAQERYAEGLTNVLNYMNMYPGFADPLAEGDVAAAIEALTQSPPEGE